MPTLRMKVTPKFPAQVLAGSGIIISQSGGVYTFSVDTGIIPSLDPDLLAIAGLTSAADKGIYFTGSATAGTYTLTSFGRTWGGLVDVSAARSTLGMGTAALVDTGTSGTKVPLLDGNNTHSGAVIFSGSTSVSRAAGGNPILSLTDTDPGSFGGIVTIWHNSASPANGDRIFDLRASFNNASAAQKTGFEYYVTADDVTAGSEDSTATFFTIVAGSVVTQMTLSGGMTLGSATAKGTGTLAASGSLTANSGTAIPAGGTAGAGLLVSSVANFGVFFGSGVPSLSAAKGSLYLRSDGSTTNDRMYVNTNGTTGWAAVTTAS